jgi:DNA-binding transcriptional LysR family regulator
VLGQAFRSHRPDVELLTEEIWNSRMAAALHDGTIDLAVALCPEVAGDLRFAPIRREEVVVLLAASHDLAGAETINLSALASEEFVFFPRELAPRLYDTFVGLCRQGGFEPTIGKESFHTGWELGLLSDVQVVSLVPESVAHALPDGVCALQLAQPRARLETSLITRIDDPSPTLAAFIEVAQSVFDTESVLI